MDRVFSEEEFLGPFGIRSLSKVRMGGWCPNTHDEDSNGDNDSSDRR